MLYKAFSYNNIAIEDTTCLNLSELYDPLTNKIYTQRIRGLKLKGFVIITLPYLFKKHYKVLNDISKLFAEFHSKVYTH